jgi:hypothetical protein
LSALPFPLDFPDRLNPIEPNPAPDKAGLGRLKPANFPDGLTDWLLGWLGLVIVVVVGAGRFQ